MKGHSNSTFSSGAGLSFQLDHNELSLDALLTLDITASDVSSWRNVLFMLNSWFFVDA